MTKNILCSLICWGHIYHRKSEHWIKKKKNWVKGFFCCLTLKTTSSSSYILNTLKYIFIYLYWVFTLLSLILSILWQPSTCFPIPKAESSSEFNLYFCKRKVKGILRRYTTWNAKDQHADIKFMHHWYEAHPNAIRVYTQRKTHTTLQMSMNQGL